MVKHITLETLEQVYMTIAPKSLGIADLGCSCGQNTLTIIREMVETIDKTSRKLMNTPPPEFRLYLNDLPTNDFNAIFKVLPEFNSGLKKQRNRDGSDSSIYLAGYPASFYGRLFPDQCLHFIYSSYSLHWLSRVPQALYDEQGKSVNKGVMYISKSSPEHVSQAYLRQFRDDFSLFLRSRSEELVTGGRMVLIFLGREGPDHFDRGNTFLWELLSRSFATLVSRGEVEQERVDEYDVHFYAPSKDELDEEVRREGSFETERFEMFEIEKADVGACVSHGIVVAKTVRAIQETMISHHFGGGILDSLFEKYASLVDEEMAIQDIRPITFMVVLKKL